MATSRPDRSPKPSHATRRWPSTNVETVAIAGGRRPAVGVVASRETTVIAETNVIARGGDLRSRISESAPSTAIYW